MFFYITFVWEGYHVRIGAKHFASGIVGLTPGDQKPLGLRPSGLLVTLVQAHKALSKVFCSLNKIPLVPIKMFLKPTHIFLQLV